MCIRDRLTPSALKELLGSLVYRQAFPKNPECHDQLEQFRSIVDEIDDELMNVLKKRMRVMEQMGDYKKEHDVTIFQLERWQEILRLSLIHI